jgi:hypothetical protein
VLVLSGVGEDIHRLAISVSEMAAPQNGQMSALELSALAGVTPEQLAIIARAMQSGALPLPPLAQPANLPLKSAPINRAEAIAISAAGDADREEGELADEQEEHEHTYEHGALRAPPTGPRNKSQPPRGKSVRADALGQSVSDVPKSSSMQHVRQNAHHEGQNTLHTGTGKHGAASNHMTTIDRTHRYPQGHHRNALKSARRQKLSEFLHVMINAGFSQEQLASQVSNPDALRQMTVALGLHPYAPVSDPNPLPSVTNGIDSVRSSDQSLATHPKSIQKSAPAKPAGLDRSAYLAKLQAAKNKKPDTMPKPTTAKATTTLKALDATKISQPVVKAAIAPPKLSPGAKAAKDELLRQRLEALRAAKLTTPVNLPASLPRKIGPSTYSAPQPVDEHARSVISALTDINKAAEYTALMQGPPPESVAVPAFGKAALPMPAAKSTTGRSAPSSLPTVSTPGSNTTTVHSGLPGLFLTPTQQLPKYSQPDAVMPLQGVGKPALPDRQSVLGPPTKPLLRGGGGPQEQSPTHSTAAPSVLFGSRDSIDEQMIITVSDDEDDDDIMDISSSDREQSSSELNHDTRSKVAALHVNPARPGIHRSNTSPSAVTTAPNTPKTNAYNKKLQELEVLKQRLAEIELRKQAKTISKPDSPVVISTPAVQDHVHSVEPALPVLANELPRTDQAPTTATDIQSNPTTQDSAPLPIPDEVATIDEEQQTDDDDDDAMDMSDDATTVSSESVNDEYEPELESDSPAEPRVQPGAQQFQTDVEVTSIADDALSAHDEITPSQMVVADDQSATQQRSDGRQDVSLPFPDGCFSN